MLVNEIRELKEELNNMILSCSDYSKVYELSVKLDKLIVQYYVSKIKIGQVRN